ncbi:MAG: hypothetical protein JWN70_5596 [Planctomycetaceae bacterium]|nr:hypothetical protein [Planctomycetaceae bacterium]
MSDGITITLSNHVPCDNMPPSDQCGRLPFSDVRQFDAFMAAFEQA